MYDKERALCYNKICFQQVGLLKRERDAHREPSDDKQAVFCRKSLLDAVLVPRGTTCENREKYISIVGETMNGTGPCGRHFSEWIRAKER